MSATITVLGVLGLCWVGFVRSTQSRVPKTAAWRVRVLGVLGLRTRARRRLISSADSGLVNIFHANPQKPNTPNTPNSASFKALILLGSVCVGSVLGCAILCWVLNSEGWQ
jgi:hypothetical protein